MKKLRFGVIGASGIADRRTIPGLLLAENAELVAVMSRDPEVAEVQTNFNIPDEAAKWRVEFFGTKGRLLGDTIIGQNDMGKLNAVFIEKNVAYSATQNHADDAGVEIAGNFGNLYTREVESFCDSVLNDKPLEVPAADAVHVQRIMEKAYRSGQEMKIFEI